MATPALARMGERVDAAHAVTEGRPLNFCAARTYILIDASVSFTDEAALYDRQIRLWGLDAQNRIRKAHLLVINLDGLTTEAIKNWVLAGISTLTIADIRETTQWHDLSAGFFWREADVGATVRSIMFGIFAPPLYFLPLQRLPPAAARIQALNPLVKINVLSPEESKDLLEESSSRLADLQASVMVVGVPSGPAGMCKEWGHTKLVSLRVFRTFVIARCINNKASGIPQSTMSRSFHILLLRWNFWFERMDV